eukprot:CAMPEP_0115669420 /NCGR_PEP_ID=MMETSP0272-20121206/50987_1 /TAXON_ID=71861 /ORGANISM="Scrippsiella trochoidea, Strain CCMP3099" /LENGTH=64 /DNA_ID=CAMNT_0003108079 /DNA_START=547 /DNA_END=738 /DNA_ORIENTATION=+
MANSCCQAPNTDMKHPFPVKHKEKASSGLPLNFRNIRIKGSASPWKSLSFSTNRPDPSAGWMTH